MLGWLKTRIKGGNYLKASVGLMGGMGPLGARARPFDYDAAVEQFGSWVYAAAMLNAQAVAAVPLRLYARKRPGERLFSTRPVPPVRKRYLRGDGGAALPSAGVLRKAALWGEGFEEVTEPHPALQVLTDVNPYLNGFELTVLRMLYLQITGNAYIHPVIDPALGRPSQMWVMPSQWTRIIPSSTKFIEGYSYGATLGNQQSFAPQEVIHWKLPSLESLYYGKGRLEGAWTAAGLHEAKRQMDQARFDNHARPDFLMVVKQGASAEALDRFEKQVDAKLRGSRRSGRFIAITGDVEAVPLNFPPEVIGDADRVVEEIAACFGVPISKLLANNPNRAAAQTADSAWLRDTVLPYCRLDEDKLNQGYLPLFGVGDDAFLAYDNPVPEDKAFQLKRRTSYVAAGIMTINEARAEEGLPPLSEPRP